MGFNWRKALNLAFPLQGLWVSKMYNQWAAGKERKNGVGPSFASQYGRAVPVIYGRPKVSSGTIVYFRDLAGGGGVGAPVRVLVGEAGVTAINAYWIDAKRTSGAGTFAIQDGTQTAGTISGDNPRNLAYKRSSIIANLNGIAGVVSALQMPRAAFEVLGKFDATGHVSGDADPAQVVVDMLTNTTYGLGWDASRVTVDEWGDDAVLATRQAASYDTWVNGGPLALTMSRACTERKPIRDYLEEFLDATHATVQWQFDTAGVATLYFVPRGDTAGGLYAPVSTVRYALTAADLIPNEAGERVEIQDEDGDTRADQDNTLTVGFIERFPTDPIGFQVAATVEVEDPVSVARDGLKRGPTIDLPCLTQRGPTTALGKELLKHQLYRGRPKMRFRTFPRFARLDPLDFVSITDDALGLSAYKVQVAAIEEDEEGVLTIDAVPAPLTLGNAVEHVTQSSDGDHEPTVVPRPFLRDVQVTINASGTVVVVSGDVTASRVAATPDYLSITFDEDWVGAYSVALTEFWDSDHAPIPTIDDRPAVVSMHAVTASGCALVFYDVWNGANVDPLQSNFGPAPGAKLHISLRFTGYV